LEYEKAILCYSECLKKLDEEKVPFESLIEQKRKLRCVVLSNRAMAYLKNQETLKAIEDATESIKYNPKYAKSYYRRA
jgi:tetratricopeptide (TPR) repeat protein